ncbi:MAG TPA: N-acetylmuramic acid 6-phosphate etherase [Candidatus Bathyarchaeia archaeon]|nr:N-acetylmuramic acid 6-phosphate etherase [Candidatus Bathyarchaeia archaeon]
MTRIRFDRLPTERPNPRSRALDRLAPAAIARLMNRADRDAIRAVGRAAPAIGGAVTAIADRLGTGGRLIFLGAGTSGRLGVIEAAECPPTFNTSPGQVRAVMAGGRRAVFRSVEGAEDDAGAGRRAVRRRARRGDALVGIAASGVTPFVRGALAEARRRGTLAVLVTCNPDVPRAAADLVIVLRVGPEVLAGSTRLKAGTATKLALNTITTGVFTRLGKVHGNRMVDLQPRSAKLRARAERLVAELGRVSPSRARRLLLDAGGSAKVAIVMARRGEPAAAARRRLAAAQGFLGRALDG